MRRLSINNPDRKTFRIEMCSAIAAVVLGDPSAYEIVNFSAKSRWMELDSRRVDLLLHSAHTVEREVREVCTLTKNIFSELERVKSHSKFSLELHPDGFHLFRAISPLV